MRTTSVIGLAAALVGGAVAQQCTSAQMIHDFSANTASGMNNVNGWSSDDGSMQSMSASNGVLSFTPATDKDSYFYTNLGCQAARDRGYNSVQFDVKGPAGSNFLVEFQSKNACADSNLKESQWIEINGLTGNTQRITIPFSNLNGPNTNALTALIWSTWGSQGQQYQLDNVQFGCSNGGGNQPAPSTTPAPTNPGSCSPLLIDDWQSQSRLTFLFYNSLIEPTSDDGTMQSLEVNKPGKNRVTITPKDRNSYFYSKLGCVDTRNKYGGASLRIKAPAGTTLSLTYETSSSCDNNNMQSGTQSSTDLGWTFDGTEKVYTIPFSRYSNINLEKVTTLFISQMSGPVSFGPVGLYCGNSGSEIVVTPSSTAVGPSSTVAAPTGTAAPIVIDRFANQNTNALGFYHGADEGMNVQYANSRLTIRSSDSDYAYYTQVSGSCSDFRRYSGSYLHIAYTGSTAFTVALQQHNSRCNSAVAPYPETWDSVEASRYAKNGHIYIPMNHFNVNLQRAIGFSLKGFYTQNPTELSIIEIVRSVPRGFIIPNKAQTGELVFACKRPNSFAFAIDDGIPSLAAEVMEIIRSEGIKVTFFTVGAPLLDESTNLTNVYRQQLAAGHQLALHSYTHPKMEGLPDYGSIDWEYNEDVRVVKEEFNGLTSKYFRPPFGNEGARMRSRLTQSVGNDAKITMWSVDVEDWLWAETSTPENQLKAFQRDVDKGGNLVVLHYLYPSTVSYLRQFIQIAKATGKQLMRVDQCMNDPNAPPL